MTMELVYWFGVVFVGVWPFFALAIIDHTEDSDGD